MCNYLFRFKAKNVYYLN
uniref:Uncharacterized protein n=1 Tax=Arundo donax TaxID=35708 RepID=A0A0A9AK06_ARUDO